MNQRRSQSAFTLIEILVVVAIIGILAALITQVIQVGVVSSQRISCASNMRQVGAALHLYATDNEGRLPYNYGGSVGPQQLDGVPTANDNGRVALFLAPYVDDSVWDCPDPLNRRARRMSSDRGAVWTKYSDTLTADYMDPQAKRLSGFPAPASVALFFCGYSPADGNGTPGHRPWPHRGTINLLYLDGHVVGNYRPTWPD